MNGKKTPLLISKGAHTFEVLEGELKSGLELPG